MNNLIVSRPKNIEFNKISEAMKFNYQLEDKGKKFMLSFMEKLKSKSLSSKKQWRHTLSQNYNFQKIAKLTHQERKSNAEISKIKRNWPVLVKRMRGEK